MYNIYICPLQTCRHFTLKLIIQGHPWSAKLPHAAHFKSACISLVISPRGLACEANLYEIMGSESSGVVRFGLGPLLQGQMRISKFKGAYNFRIIGPRGLKC